VKIQVVLASKPSAVYVREVRPHLPTDATKPIGRGFTSMVWDTATGSSVLLATRDPLKKAWLLWESSTHHPLATLEATLPAGGGMWSSLPIFLLRVPKSLPMPINVKRTVSDMLVLVQLELLELKKQYPAMRECAKQLHAKLVGKQAPFADFLPWREPFAELFEFLSTVGGWKLDTSTTNYRMIGSSLVLSDPIISSVVHNTIHRTRANQYMDRVIIKGR